MGGGFGVTGTVDGSAVVVVVVASGSGFSALGGSRDNRQCFSRF